MSCRKCEEEPVTTWVRVGNGNVLVRGCVKHLREMLLMLNKARGDEKLTSENCKNE